MPKMKTKKIVRHRYKVTKNGKVMHEVQGARHLRSRKNSSRKRRQDRPAELTTRRFVRRIIQFLSA